MSATLVSPTLPSSFSIQRLFTHWVVGVMAAFLLVFAGMAAHAAPPPAGTLISNQASATYSDAGGTTRTVNSNIVQTTVQQVASFTLTANGAQNATAGSIVYYPHTLTNTGNGADTFSLTAVSGTTGFTMTSVQIFADNGTGQPTGPAITSTGLLASGSQFRFIVVGTLPAAAVNATTNTITVTGTSAFTPATTASNTDVTTVTANAVLVVTKAVSAPSGAPGSGPFTYSLTYTNNGNSNATAVVISDAIPAGLTYVAGSARWSVTGATALSDTGGSSGTAPNTATSTFTAGSNTFAATLAQVTPGQSGIISFSVNVAAGVVPGIRNNTATTSYNNGAATVTGSSNTVPFNVTQAASVTITGQTVAGPAAPGASVSFTNIVTNTGNGTDTFDISLGANNFPAGTTFQVFRSDGVTPMVDTNGNSVIDTGPIAPAATFNVIVRATLPPNATNAGAPFSISKTATSVADPTKSATTTDTLTAIAVASVDLRNNTAAGPGAGAGPEAGAVVTNTAAGGTTTTFTLVANNTGPSPDSYNLAASTVSTFATTTLPAGYTVTYRADGGTGTCSTLGTTISNTGTVAATTGSVVVCAVVSVPAGAPAATSDIYFRVLSPTSGATDIVHDALTVSATRSIVITNAGNGQAFPGGSVVYTHTLTNAGNVVEGNGTVSSIALASTNNQAGFTSALYYDANGNGVLDATDPLFTGNLNTVAGLTAGLAPGQSITVFDRVIAPSGATAGAVDVTTITVTTTNGSYTTTAPAPAVISDTTTVIAGNLTLTKAQAVDTACAGPTGATTYAPANLSARPNQCVLYQITVTNVGSGNATAVVVSDATPTFTTISSVAAVTVGTVTGPIVGASGTVSATVGTLTPGQAAVLTFGVRITP